MQLDYRLLGGIERIQDGDGGVRIGPRVENDAAGFLAGLLDPVHELAFRVRLAEVRK